MTPDELKEEIRKAFREKKLEPARRTWGVSVYEENGLRVFQPSDCVCCAFGALLAGKDVPAWFDYDYANMDIFVRVLMEKFGLSSEDVRSFLYGWDSGGLHTVKPSDNPYRVAGDELSRELITHLLEVRPPSWGLLL